MLKFELSGKTHVRITVASLTKGVRKTTWLQQMLGHFQRHRWQRLPGGEAQLAARRGHGGAHRGRGLRSAFGVSCEACHRPGTGAGAGRPEQELAGLRACSSSQALHPTLDAIRRPLQTHRGQEVAADHTEFC